ncbi:uncharacterized protein LOC126864047 [Bombus huntii]|uniref:uncharacterized protein LOC126864047 n=1 Tax=Bombus huntii TaxID=85661 RepID=UPI0021AA4784|nr:uncharacterized protein LOC126864047 [Bombus huntii]XP_050470931.1 uncharacterized protein LOC126864047 [Bombus huntii]
MLVNCTTRNTGPIPAYGTTRYSGVINLEENGNKYFINSPRNAHIGLLPPCTKTDKWSKKSRNNRAIRKEDGVCRNSTESTILSICGTIRKESSHCTCKDEASCICLENERKLKSLSEDCSDCCTNWKEIQKLTDTSETKLTDSFEKLLNCVENDGDTSMYLDLFEPHPREEQRIKGKDSIPLGYDMTLILPQCVCLKNYQETKQIENESEDTIRDEKSETINDLICAPSIIDLSWNIMQSGMIEKIPEKYTTNIFENEKKEPIGTEVCSNVQTNVCTEGNSQTTYCLHKAFLEKINKSYFSM